MSTAAVPTKLPPDKEIGRTLFLQNCWQCHGKAGLGDGPLAAQLGGIESIQKVYEAEDAAVAPIQDGKGDMPAFSQIFGKEDSKRILMWLTAVAQGEDPDAAAPTVEKNKKKPVPKPTEKAAPTEKVAPIEKDVPTEKQDAAVGGAEPAGGDAE